MYPFSAYRIVRWEKGKYPKKYKVILQNKTTKREVSVQFGDIRYSHYRDKTPLKLYSSKNHLDKERRDAYKSRHQGDNLKMYSPGYFSWYYLW